MVYTPLELHIGSEGLRVETNHGLYSTRTTHRVRRPASRDKSSSSSLVTCKDPSHHDDEDNLNCLNRIHSGCRVKPGLL